MAMSGSVLGAAIVSAIGITSPPLSPADLAIVTAKWISISSEIVDHIKTFMVVSTDASPLVTPPNAVVPLDGGATLQTGIAAKAATPLLSVLIA